MQVSESLLYGCLVSFWSALAVAGVFANPILQTLIRLKSRQTVSQFAPEGHQKKQGTPTMGGLIVVLGALAAFGVLAARGSTFTPQFVLLVGFAAIGFIDDFVVPRVFPGKRGLGWKQKILMQFGLAIAAALLWRGTFDLAAAEMVFLVLFFSNAYNFSDGLDGLAGTLLLGLGFGLTGIAMMVGAPESVVTTLIALMGAIVPFLFLNAPPAKVFMGDVGSLPIGALVGYVVTVIAIPPKTPDSFRLLAWTNNGLTISSGQVLAALAVVSIMMVVELVPVPLQVLSVKLRKKKLFPYTPIHHAFEKAGWPESRVVWMFALIQVLCSALAIAILLGIPARPAPVLERPTVMR